MRTKTAVKAELSRDTVVDRALAIADVEGLDAVTIRRLAQEFGVTPMALYWHVSNKDELLAAMGDRLFADLDADAVASTGPWPQQLRRLVAAVVGALRAHPAAAVLGSQRILYSDSGRDLAERALELLVRAGFDVGMACDIARHSMQTAVMLVTQQPGELTTAAELREGLMAEKRAAIASLPVDRFPLLAASAVAFTSCEDNDGYYRFGIDLFVAGVEGMLPRRASKTR
ncbi:MAG TPA: TetR family transcriptional regulator [Jatrophihabitantaceae bacterium]|nr:TetR family transcriptional regulator [Jatrophihabitantaceae bacterium]